MGYKTVILQGLFKILRLGGMKYRKSTEMIVCLIKLPSYCAMKTSLDETNRRILNVELRELRSNKITRKNFHKSLKMIKCIRSSCEKRRH